MYSFGILSNDLKVFDGIVPVYLNFEVFSEVAKDHVPEYVNVSKVTRSVKETGVEGGKDGKIIVL